MSKKQQVGGATLAAKRGSRLPSETPKRSNGFRPLKMKELKLPPPEVDLRKLEKAVGIKFWNCCDGEETASHLVELVRNHFSLSFPGEKRRMRRLLNERRKYGHLPTYVTPVDLMGHDIMQQAGVNLGRRGRGSLSILII